MHRKWSGFLEAAGILVLSGLASIVAGQDANWDLANYHLYNGFALWEGRLGRDLYVSGIQSYLNPLLDLPYYLTSVALFPTMPRLVMFLAGLSSGVLILLLMAVARVFPDACFPAGPTGRWCAVLIGMSGTVVVSEIGTTFNDIPVAALVLAGLLPLLRRLTDPVDSCAGWVRAAGLCGGAVGMAVGLKLTAGIFVVPLALAVSLIRPWRRGAAGGAIALVLSGTVGFAVTYGWWGWQVWQLTGNPFFPLLNDLFKSPWMPPLAGRDLRFLPSGFAQSVFFPFFWLSGRAWVVAEVGIRDPRFALAWLSVVLAAAASAIATLRPRSPLAARMAAMQNTRAVAFLMVLFGGAFVAWEVYFGILRYALGLETLTGLVILFGLSILEQTFPAASVRRQWVLLVLTLGVVAFGSAYFNWGRADPAGSRLFTTEAVTLPDDSRIVTVSPTVSFMIPFIGGQRIDVVGISGVPPKSGLADQILHRLAGEGPVYVLGFRDEGLPALHGYGWDVDLEECREVVNQIRHGVQLCRARRFPVASDDPGRAQTGQQPADAAAEASKR